MFSNKKIVKLTGEIDKSVLPVEIRIKPTTGDAWTDFGYWLEALNFMAYQAALEQGWNKKQTLDYVMKYLDKSFDDINAKSSQ